MRVAYVRVKWWLKDLWWHLIGGRLYSRSLRCDHPCCVNRVPHADLPEGECPCLDRYRSTLREYVQLRKERETEEYWKNYRK